MTDTDSNGGNGVGARLPEFVIRPAQPKRIILVIARWGTISRSLLHAVEREFPWIVVEHCEDVASACASFAHPVALILVDPAFLRRAEQAAEALTSRHPTAYTAVIENGEGEPSRSFFELAQSPLIRGILPMDRKLDIWLSIVRLMLCGGEFFPKRTIDRIETPRMAPTSLGPGRPASTGTRGQGLTSREMQILAMVERGMQNKTIATAFSLSEHTVKIHLHHIIAKLGVHNRTEAAAWFRNRFDQRFPR